MIIKRNGSTRIVFLTNNLAIKFPNVSSGFKLFICGLLANINEASFSNYAEGLPTTYYSNIFGIVNICKRCKPVNHAGLFWINLEELIAKSDLPRDFWESDAKPENFGYCNGSLIKIDTGA